MWCVERAGSTSAAPTLFFSRDTFSRLYTSSFNKLIFDYILRISVSAAIPTHGPAAFVVVMKQKIYCISNSGNNSIVHFKSVEMMLDVTILGERTNSTFVFDQ